jgi:CheY-like chemotaxis protein
MPNGGRFALATGNMDIGPAEQGGTPPIPPGAYVRLTASDTGSGMDEKTMNRLFEPFFTTKEVGLGAGLGLTTVREIVIAANGHIFVDSRVGQGTTFTIYFPRTGEAQTSRDCQPQRRELARGTERIMVVEDDERVRSLIGRVLTQCGYTIVEAGGGLDALEWCAQEQRPIDLLLADVATPQMSGPELAGRLMPIWPEMKIVYMSGYANTAAPEPSPEGEAIPFLQKPFSPAALARKVREVLDGRAA